VSVAQTYQTYRLQLEKSRLDMPVLFENQSLSEKVKTTVIDDYKLIFGHYNEYLFRPYDSGEVTIGGKKFKLSYAVNYEGGYHIRPDDYDFNTIAVDSETQEKCLFIYKNLSDAYQEAISLKASNEEAFVKLDEFIYFFNNLEAANLPDSVDKLLFLPGEAQEFNVTFDGENSAKFVEGYGRYEYKKSSILEFKIGQDEFEGQLVTNIIMILKNSDPIKANEQLIIYHEGRWKFVNIWMLQGNQ
jgi:hypothetical protein